MYTLEVLIATMHRENKESILNLLNDMNINSDCVVVSQCNKDGMEKFNYKHHNVTCVYSTERGLSKSRNLALKNATADIVIIADDDLRYNDNYPEIVTSMHAMHPEYDVLTFKVNDDKKYYHTEKKLNRFLIHGVISYEITMKLSSVKAISFNVFFGTGSSYFQCGEENIFLNSCIMKGKKAMFIPLKIASLDSSRSSTWFTGYNEKFMIWKGAVYYELSPFFVLPYIFQFALRKYSLYKKNMSFLTAIYYMICGIKANRKLLKDIN